MPLIPIQIYFIICSLILFFTIGYIIYQRFYRSYELRSVGKYSKEISNQHLMLQQVGSIEPRHRKSLERQLSKINNLVAFEKALAQLDSESDENDDYLMELEDVIVKLTIDYKNFDHMRQAYLANFIAKYAKRGKWEDAVIYKNLLSYLSHPTVYLRENVLLATYQQPNARWIIQVLHFLTENDLFHHPKLIQDGLLTSPFDAEELMNELWEKRATFQPSTFLGLIGFITFKSDSFKEDFYQMLKEEKTDLEVKTSLMRYFKKHHFAKAEAHLISLIHDKQDAVRIVAANVLGAYRSDCVIATLKEALGDKNWHVRRNASQSLLSMNIQEHDMADILQGEDRYAKEMLRYQLDMQRSAKYEPVS